MCPGSSVQFSGSSIYHVTSLPAASDGNGVFKLDTCLLKGRRVRIEITYQPNGTAVEWFIDSVSQEDISYLFCNLDCILRLLYSWCSCPTENMFTPSLF